MTGVRRPAVAGMFYPARPETLERDVGTFIAGGRGSRLSPKALIVPHAGFMYSGPIAGSGYRCLEPDRDAVQRIVLVGPAHRVPFRGIATPTVRAFATPLGEVEMDREALGALDHLPYVVRKDEAHAPEHSLEVHLPFLQVALSAFRLVPLLVGDAVDAQVAEVLETLWGGPGTRIVVSTDLSHYLEYEEARKTDLRTAMDIEAYAADMLHGRRACGYVGVRALLQVAERRGLRIHRLDLRTSGDTAGPKDQVVGYGAWALTETV